MADVGETFTFVDHDMVPAASVEENKTLQGQREQILKWLQPTDYLSPGNEFMKHLHAYLPGTGEWLRESAVFRSWSGDECADDVGIDTDSGYHHVTPVPSSDASCLHIRGVAGSGKSVFSANTIFQLHAKYLIRDFAAQLLQHSRILTAQLTELSKNESVSSLGSNRLWSVISKAIIEGAVNKKVYCVVDALDEMDDADFPDMMEKLITLGSANHRAVKMMFTGRPLPKIERAVQDRNIMQLKLDPVLLSPDVARYVDARMALLNPRLSEAKCELVTQAICARASGLFLHARLVADNLAESLKAGITTEETLPDSLDKLPRSLREVYEEMLKEHAQRSGVSADCQAKILACVTHSSRPMRLIELGSLVSQMFSVDLRKGKELVRASCGRLLELLEDETVSVIHHSFTEFLHDSARKEIQNAFIVLGDCLSHDMLAALCLEYLNSCPHFDTTWDETRQTDEEDIDPHDSELSENKRRDAIRIQLRLTHPLAAYAAANLGFHLTKAGKLTESHGFAALDSFFIPQTPAFETWILINYKGKLTSSINTLHLLTADRAIPLVVIQHIVEGHPELVGLPDPQGQTPLLIASKLGQHDIAEFLISKGASLYAADLDGMTSLHWAAKNGHSLAVEALLKSGIDPLIKTVPVYSSWDYDGFVRYSEREAQANRKTALSMALRGASLEVASRFIPFMPAESAAYYFHHAKSAEILNAILETGLVDVNSYMTKDMYEYGYEGYNKTKLFNAASCGDLDMVKVLLEHGADPTVREPGKPTALHGVAGIETGSNNWYEGDEKKAQELVKLLVDAGADINATIDERLRRCEIGYTPLHLAVHKRESSGFEGFGGPEEVVSLALLLAGADPNAATSLGDSPLHLVNPQRLKLIRVLVENGADIDQKNAKGQSPFLRIIHKLIHESTSARFGPNEVAASLHGLLDLGADPCVIDSCGNNVFHYTFEPGRSQSEEQSWGDTHIWYKRCKSYLSNSPKGNNEKLLSLLIFNGMQLDARNKAGDTFLHHLVRWCDIAIEDVKMFIRLGADPNHLGSNGKTLFRTAIKANSSSEWLEYLMSISNSTTSIDDEGNTIIHDMLLHMRSSVNFSTCLGLAISAGVDPLARNYKGQSAFHVVQPEEVKFVLDSPCFRLLDINGTDSDGLTALHKLATCGVLEFPRMLQRGGDPFVRSHAGLLPLDYAAQAGEAAVVDLLLTNYPLQSVLLQDLHSIRGGMSPLHYACQAGSADTVAVLLQSGADPTLVDDTGFTPLQVLSRFVPATPDRDWISLVVRTPDIVHMLHRRGADVDATVSFTRDEDGRLVKATALDLAIESKRWEVVRELLACGASMKYSQNVQSREFLLATDKDLALEALHEMKAKADNELSDSSDLKGQRGLFRGQPWRSRWTPTDKPIEEMTNWILGSETLFNPKHGRSEGCASKLEVFRKALIQHDFDTIKEYQQHGGDLCEKFGHELDLLQVLICDGYEHLLRHFKDQAIQRDIKGIPRRVEGSQTSFSTTLLGTVCMNSTPSMHIMEWLVDEVGVSIDSFHYTPYGDRTSPMDTPLHILSKGSEFWHLAALRYLLSKGANIEARTHDGLTPLLVALDQHDENRPWNIEAARILLEYGANVNARTEHQSHDWGDMRLSSCAANLSALDLAKKPAAFELLVSAGVDGTHSPDAIMRSVRMWMLPKAVQVLLDAGFDPNTEPLNMDAHRKQFRPYDSADTREGLLQFSNRYALHEAARATALDDPGDLAERQLAMTELLLARGADPYAKYPDGSFVLQRIAEDRGLFTACLALIKDAKLDMRGSNDRTLLVQTCIPGARNTDPYLRVTPVQTVMVNAIAALVEAGADVTLADDQGRTALHWVCTQTVPLDADGQEAFKALVARDPSMIEIADHQGRLPLHLALEAFSCRETSMDFVIRHLVASGADLGITDPVTGNSALHFIARSLAGDNHEAVLQAEALFQDLAASLDINAQNDAGQSVAAATVASEYSTRSRWNYAKDSEHAYVKALEFLAGLGAKLDVTDAKGRNLLHVAAAKQMDGERNIWREVDMIKELFVMLIGLGLDPRKEDSELLTPIDIAVAREFTAVVNLFSEDGKRLAPQLEEKQDTAKQPEF